jgi:hypothetical protein
MHGIRNGLGSSSESETTSSDDVLSGAPGSGLSPVPEIDNSKGRGGTHGNPLGRRRVMRQRSRGAQHRRRIVVHGPTRLPSLMTALTATLNHPPYHLTLPRIPWHRIGNTPRSLLTYLFSDKPVVELMGKWRNPEPSEMANRIPTRRSTGASRGRLMSRSNSGGARRE